VGVVPVSQRWTPTPNPSPQGGGERSGAIGETGEDAMSDTEFRFEAPVIYWRGPAPHVFAKLPDDVAEGLRALGPGVSYGWGCIPVAATIADVAFTTALIPKDGTYLLPLKVAVRRKVALEEGRDVAVEMRVTRG
jgi:hypothetical protein